MDYKNFIFGKSLEELNRSIESYLENYCFSTLDIILSDREILSLELGDLYDKIIINKRGGYCFEHNKLFGYFLELAGIKTIKQLARVTYGRDIDAPRTHRVNINRIGGELYLADVGFGAHNPTCLVPLSGKEVRTHYSKRYRISCINGKYSLEMERDGIFVVLYSFDMAEYTEADFTQASYYSNTYPTSKHANSLVLSKIDGNKIYALSDMEFIQFDQGNKKSEKILSQKVFEKTLSSYFNINLTQDEYDKLYQKIHKL